MSKDNEILTEMRAGFAKMDARFEQVDARFDQVDARFEQVDARFEQVDARLDVFEDKLEDVRERVTGLERSDVSTAERLRRIEVSHDTLVARFDTLETTVQQGFEAVGERLEEQVQATAFLASKFLEISVPLLRIAGNMEASHAAELRRDRQLNNHEERIRALEDDEEAG